MSSVHQLKYNVHIANLMHFTSFMSMIQGCPIHIHMHTTHQYKLPPTHLHIYAHTHAHAHTSHTCTHAHTCTHTHAHTYTHTHAHSPTHFGTLPKRHGSKGDEGVGGSTRPKMVGRSLPNERYPRSGSWNSHMRRSNPVLPSKYSTPPPERSK